MPDNAPQSSTSAGVLAGVRVLDLSIWRPGPYATQLLAELGAEVTKVEPPGGDPMRAYPELFAILNARKNGFIRVDLKTEDGRARVRELARESDIAVEGWRPGVAARLGVSYDDLRAVNPQLVYCSISGYGASGPLVNAPGHDVNYVAYAGMLPPGGHDPSDHPQPPFADVAGGMAAAFAICGAYAGRLRSGTGSNVDVSMTDVIAEWVRPIGASRALTGGRVSAGAPGYGAFATSDGAIALGIISEDQFWDALCREVGLPELVGVDFAARNERAEELRPLLEAAIAAGRRDELVTRLQASNVPASPVLSRDEMVAHPHFAPSDRRSGIRIVRP